MGVGGFALVWESRSVRSFVGMTGSSPSRIVLAALLGAALLLAGCGGGDTDKAGGAAGRERSGPAACQLQPRARRARAVRRGRSSGPRRGGCGSSSSTTGARASPDAEPGVLDDVRAGKVDLAWVGARAFKAEGVTRVRSAGRAVRGDRLRDRGEGADESDRRDDARCGRQGGRAGRRDPARPAATARHRVAPDASVLTVARLAPARDEARASRRRGDPRPLRTTRNRPRRCWARAWFPRSERASPTSPCVRSVRRGTGGLSVTDVRLGKPTQAGKGRPTSERSSCTTLPQGPGPSIRTRIRTRAGVVLSVRVRETQSRRGLPGQTRTEGTTLSRQEKASAPSQCPADQSI